MTLNPREPLYDVEVHLSTGCDSSIGAVMAKVRDALRAAGKDPGIADAMWKEIFAAGSFTESLAIVMRYVSVT